MFDDTEGGEWQLEPDDWWQQEEHMPDDPTVEATQEPVNLEVESVQVALNSRLRRTTRLIFFDDESGGEDMQIGLGDFNLVIGLVDRRAWP